MIKLYDLKDCLEDLDELMDMTYEEWGMFFRSSKQNKIDRIKASILNCDEFPKVYVLKKDEKLIGSFTIKDKDLVVFGSIEDLTRIKIQDMIEMDKLDEENLGQLIYFFEKACAISGSILEVNPFNQPGVEEYKKNMFRLLEKPGY